jgi:hypothetical protein
MNDTNCVSQERDDLNPYTRKEDAIKLKQDLDAAGKWEQDWLMHFHSDKCTVVSVTQKRKTISHTYQLHGHTLEKVIVYEYEK